MAELISVSVLLADRTYRLKILPEDEEKLRNTVKVINNKVVEFKTSFAGKDMQDYIAMVLLWLATEQKTTGDTDGEQMKSASKKVGALKSLIEKSLES